MKYSQSLPFTIHTTSQHLFGFRLFFLHFLLLLACPAFSQNQLLIPDTLSGNVFQLEIKDTSHVFYPGFTTSTFGINASYLGPTLILHKGDSIQMHVFNQLMDTTTIHWHGMHVSPMNDGGPHVTIPPGITWSPAFVVRDLASTHWYHPHLHMMTNLHASKGAAGLIIVRDNAESLLNLPRTYGTDDFPLVIQSKCFDSNKQILIDNAYDSVMVVNGTVNTYLSVPAQVVRLRVLNASSERVYNLGLQNNMSFYQIGSDGGLLNAPVLMTRLPLAPGERAEILVDFTGLNGQSIDLMSFASELPNAIYGALQPGMGAGMTLPGYSNNLLNGSNFKIMNFQVAGPTINPVLNIPATLINNTPIPAQTSNVTRNLTFSPANMGPTALQGPFLINNQAFDMNVINYNIPLGNTEIWTLTNQSPIAHPFHIHNVQFYILDINGVAPPPGLSGRKDVILVPAGMGTVRFITRFDDFCDPMYPYMYHCHMLTHEDDGMMGQFLVTCPAPSGISTDANPDQPRIYPNPGTGLFQIIAPHNMIINRLEIYSVEGKLIKAIEGDLNPVYSFSLNEAISGLYFARVHCGSEVYQVKIFKE